MVNFLGALNFTQMLFTHYLIEQGNNARSNFVISPVSAFIPMCMVNNGAKGTTRDEIQTALQLTPENGYCGEAQNLVKSFNTSAFTEFTLNMANGLFISKTFEPKNNFTNSLRDNYNSDIKRVEFGTSEGENIVNKWVEEKTNGKVTDLLKGTTRSTPLVAINAIYLKGFWFHPFAKNLTKTEKFYTKSGEMDAKFMHCTNSFNFVKYGNYDGKKFQAVFMSYREGLTTVPWIMGLILPAYHGNPGDLKGLISDRLFGVYRTGTSKFIQLKVPKIKIETELDAVPLLQNPHLRLARISPISVKTVIFISEE